MGHPGSSGGRGRPRDPRVDRAALDAALALLAEGGPGAVTIEAVAARAGVARTTVYRRWRGRDELLAAALDDLAGRLMPTTNLGDTRADLVATVDAAIDVLTAPDTGPVIAALISRIARQADEVQELRHRLVDARRSELGTILSRGVARGELGRGTDLDASAELLLGPVYYRLLLAGRRPGPGYSERVVDVFLQVNGAAST